MIRYLLSLIDPETGFGQELGAALQRDVRASKIVFVPTTPDQQEKTWRYVRETLAAFEKAGIAFRQEAVLFEGMESAEMKRELESADVVYLMGGDTLRQRDFLRAHDLVAVLLSFQGVVIGLSAGAINMCQTAVLTPMQEAEEAVIEQGLGLVEFSVEVHYDKANSVHEQMVMSLAKTVSPFYCISDRAAIRVGPEGEIELFGDGVYQIS